MKVERVVANDLHMPECPRWHEGRLWLSDMWGHEVLSFAVDTGSPSDRRVEVRFADTEDPGGLGWLPDGRLLVVGMEGRVLYRLDGDRTVVHADLSAYARHQLNDMVVTVDGTAYVSQFGYDLWNHGAMTPSPLIAVTAEGAVSIAAEDLAVPNGVAVDGNRLVVAEPGAARLSEFTIGAGGLRDRRLIALSKAAGARLVAPDGICLDTEGAVWFADPIAHRVARWLDGQVVDEIAVADGHPLACVLGGAGRRTLLICVAPAISKPNRTPTAQGKVIAVEVEVAGSGRP